MTYLVQWNTYIYKKEKYQITARNECLHFCFCWRNYKTTITPKSGLLQNIAWLALASWYEKHVSMHYLSRSRGSSWHMPPGGRKGGFLDFMAELVREAKIRIRCGYSHNSRHFSWSPLLRLLGVRESNPSLACSSVSALPFLYGGIGRTVASNKQVPVKVRTFFQGIMGWSYS